jgi:carboxypeptidase family protein/TonB-dependent receptor-like protein
MKNLRFVVALLELTVCILLAGVLAPGLSAQTTYGSISGEVTDSSGAAIADAQVTLTNLGTLEKRTQATGNDGLYTFVNLFPGRYKIDAEKTGFKRITRPEVEVEVQQVVRIDLPMQVGDVTQSIEVSGETPLLQPETSSLGQVIEQRKANELPLNGRNIFNLIAVSPAAVAQGQAGGSPVGPNPFGWGNYQVGGSFGNESAEYLDGQPLNIGYINLPVVIPTQDSIGEFKVQYNNIGADWGKFAGGVINLSTKSGTNQFHGEAYEYLRNKVLNSKGFFQVKSPPYVQNQYGFDIGGPVPLIPLIKDKTFFFTSWEQFRLRHADNFTTTVPTLAERTPDAGGNYSFADLCPEGFTGGVCNNPAHQLYDPYSNTTGGARTAYPGNVIPSTQINPAAVTLLTFLPNPTNTSTTGANFSKDASLGGNSNESVTRIDQIINNKQRLFGRFLYWGLTDLPRNPFGTGFCQDRCTELYHTKAGAVDYNYTITSNTILDFNASVSRFVYLRSPLNAGYDLTKLGYPASYNSVPSAARTPPTPCFTEDPLVTCSQGQSFINDHNTQFNLSPQMTMIRGRHTIQFGGQLEEGYDNYVQTNIASGAFDFNGSWTSSTAGGGAVGGKSFADFVLGLAQNQATVFNHTEGAAQVPQLAAGKETYRALFVNDTFHVTNKLTLNLGLRWEFQGSWSERFDRMSYWNPKVTNATVTGCSGTAGSPCPGDVFLVKNGVNDTRNNLPLSKKQFAPRIGFAYSLNPKTVIRGGYGVFWIPNYLEFDINPDNDLIGLVTTPFVASTGAGNVPSSTINGSNCTVAADAITCATPGPFGTNGILLPPGRNINASAFAAGKANKVNPYTQQKFGYLQQWNIDVQRQLPWGFFADVAYAASKGVHLPNNTSMQVNQIPDSFIAQAAQQAAAGTTPTIIQTVPNPFVGIGPGTPLSSASVPTIAKGQFDRPFPEYSGVQLSGYGCCDSNYQSLQVSVTRRFAGAGSLLVAYTNSKLISNTDTLTTWLEDSGVGQIQDWNNLKGERSLSSQDVPQRLVISYVLDLPFGKGKMFLSDTSGVVGKLVSGWGIDGVTLFQRGFPLKITWGGANTPLANANFGIGTLRPNVIAGCSEGTPGGASSRLGGTFGGPGWINPACFTAPPAWGFGSEPRVDPTLRAQGVNNFDWAIFKRTQFGPDDKLGIEFRTEFFNLFNHPQFGAPNASFGSSSFGQVTSQANNPRLIQFALKFVF